MVRVLAVHAHPDDIETLAAGTLALLAQAGAEVTIATLTAGECGAVTDDPERTGRIRQDEARAAAALIGAGYLCAGLSDLGLFNDDRSRRAVTELIRRARPDIVIGAAPADYHPDHEAASLLTRDACFAASAPGYRCGPSAPLEAIPHLYQTDPIGARDRDGAPWRPDFGVDISTTLAVKRRMLECHRSQIDWLARQHGMADFTAGMVAQAAKRGRDFGVAHAEAFRHYRHTPYPRDPVLQGLLRDFIRPAPAP